MLNSQVLLEQYYSRLIALERRAPLTAETYRLEIRRFLGWLAEEKIVPEAADSRIISLYLDYRRKTDRVDSGSVAKAISALRSFFRFVVDEGMRTDNPASILEAPRRGRRLPAVLDRDSVERLLSTVDTGSPWGLRDRALYELVYSAGLRISEAVALNLGDIFFSEGVARIRGKGSKERLAVFGEEAAVWIKHYLTEARPLLAGLRRSPALFIGKTGKRLSRKGIWKNYAAVAALAGTSSKLHTLRHTFATELLMGGADLRSVQELLGHADLTTTQIYTHLDVSFLRESHRRHLPRLAEYAQNNSDSGSEREDRIEG